MAEVTFIFQKDSHSAGQCFSYKGRKDDIESRVWKAVFKGVDPQVTMCTTTEDQAVAAMNAEGKTATTLQKETL